MNDLLDAILSHDLASIRSILRSHPELVAVRSHAGDLPIDIAKSSGDSFTYVCLLRANAPSDKPDSNDFAQLLIDYIADLSDLHACAGWLVDIEFMVYASISGDHLRGDDIYGFGKLNQETIADLRYLLNFCHQWPHWDPDENGVRAIPIAQWNTLYRRWRSVQAN